MSCPDPVKRTAPPGGTSVTRVSARNAEPFGYRRLDCPRFDSSRRAPAEVPGGSEGNSPLCELRGTPTPAIPPRTKRDEGRSHRSPKSHPRVGQEPHQAALAGRAEVRAAPAAGL